MAGDGTSTDSQAALDRHLAELIAQEQQFDASINASTATATPRSHAGESVSVDQLRSDFVSSIRAGMRVPEDIYSESGILLLASGSKITPRFLHLLNRHGITRVRLGAPQAPLPVGPEVNLDEELHTPRSRSLDKNLARELEKTVTYRPIKAWRRPRLTIDDLKGEAARGVEKHQATSTAVSDLCDALRVGRRISVTEIREAVDQFVTMSTVDFDLLPLIVAMQRTKNDYLYDHCVNVALLSLALAAQLGLDHNHITAVGLGGMLQDIGMLRVPTSIRLSAGPLSEREWHEIHRHPLHTLDMLADLHGIPQEVKLIGYQAHERIDGNGYPRNRSGRQLHKYAQIISVADVYAAMTGDRPYRPALPPYLAAKTVLMDGTMNRFERTLVRGLLDTVSLFPIGSVVGLSSGTNARVLRANVGMQAHPVVEELSDEGLATGRIIDLSAHGTPRVIRAI